MKKINKLLKILVWDGVVVPLFLVLVLVLLLKAFLGIVLMFIFDLCTGD